MAAGTCYSSICEESLQLMAKRRRSLYNDNRGKKKDEKKSRDQTGRLLLNSALFISAAAFKLWDLNWEKTLR